MLLPTYSLPLPIELCRKVASYLLHPATNVKQHVKMQQQYMLERLEAAILMLDRWGYTNQREFEDLKMDVYKVGCVQKVLERDPTFAIKALVWTSTMRIAYLSGSSCTPAYMQELRVWPNKFACD